MDSYADVTVMIDYDRVNNSLTFQTESGRMSQLEQDLHQTLYSVITPGLFHIRKTYAV